MSVEKNLFNSASFFSSCSFETNLFSTHTISTLHLGHDALIIIPSSIHEMLFIPASTFPEFDESFKKWSSLLMGLNWMQMMFFLTMSTIMTGKAINKNIMIQQLPAWAL